MKIAFFIPAILIAVFGFLIYLKKPKRKTPAGLVIRMKKQHKNAALIVVCVMLLVIISMIFVKTRLFKIWMVILPNLFFAVSILLLLYAVKFKVIITPRRFYYYTAFGNRYDLDYTDIESLTVTPSAILIRAKGKRFVIDGSAKNAEAFLFRADMNAVPMNLKISGANDVSFMRDQFKWLAEAGIHATDLDDFEILCGLYGYLSFIADKSDTLYAMSKIIDVGGGIKRAISNDIFCIKLADEKDIFAEMSRIAKDKKFSHAIDKDGVVSFEADGEVHYIEGSESDIRACIDAANECLSGERKFMANHMLAGALVIYATEEEAALLRHKFGTVFV